LKLADVLCDCGCGRLVVQPRGGGPRKRFFENACRARWTRKGRQKKATPKPAPKTPDGLAARAATLQALYERLSADVDKYGTLIEGPNGMKANPSVGELRRVIADLNRFAPVEDQEQADEVSSLVAI
jgi:hypothetical protein